MPPVLTTQSNESFSRWVAFILEALRRVTGAEATSLLSGGRVARLWGYVPMGSHTQTDGASDTEMTKRNSTVVQPEFNWTHE